MLSPKEIESSKFSFVFEKNLPDKTTEFFWYGFKESILNLYKSLNHNPDLQEKLSVLIENLHNKSNFLNQLQNEKKYQEIKIKIGEYIRLFSRNLFILYADDYHFSIYLTNLKRWSKWILESKENKISFDFLKEEEDDYFMIFFNLRKYTAEKHKKDDKKDDKDVDKKDDKDVDDEQEIIKELNNYIKEYKIYSDKNKVILDTIYTYLFEKKYFKNTILTEFNKYYPVIKDLKKNNIIEKDIPDYLSIHKLFRKKF
jgi:hypothetical protein